MDPGKGVRLEKRLSLCSASGTRGGAHIAQRSRLREDVRELWRERLHVEHVDSLLFP